MFRRIALIVMASLVATSALAQSKRKTPRQEQRLEARIQALEQDAKATRALAEGLKAALDRQIAAANDLSRSLGAVLEQNSQAVKKLTADLDRLRRQPTLINDATSPYSCPAYAKDTACIDGLAHTTCTSLGFSSGRLVAVEKNAARARVKSVLCRGEER